MAFKVIRRPADQPPVASGRVVKLPLNEVGRDFIVGDLHGAYSLLSEAMRAVHFDRTRDRLFSLGDTVDRGPDSQRALGFLELPWVHAVRGNHEDMFLELYADGEPHEAAVEYVTSRNGMGWWRDLSADRRLDFIEVFRRMPVAIEVATRRGPVGLVHAEVPAGLSWPDFLSRVEAGDDTTIQQALWGRDRVRDDGELGVPGIGRVFVGHTPLARSLRRGNIFYIDTGAVFGMLAPEPPRGRLTFAELACRTRVMAADPAEGLIDVRADLEPTSRPFGAYGR